jgi:hypothetical protein
MRRGTAPIDTARQSSATVAFTPNATESGHEPAITAEVEVMREGAAAPLLVETTAVVVISAPAAPAKKPCRASSRTRNARPSSPCPNEDRFCNLAPAAVWTTLLDGHVP